MSNVVKSFYVGVKPCGCTTAAMIDDDGTSSKEIADFARNMQKTGRKVKHLQLTNAEFFRTFDVCKCDMRPNTRIDDTTCPDVATEGE